MFVCKLDTKIKSYDKAPKYILPFNNIEQQFIIISNVLNYVLCPQVCFADFYITLQQHFYLVCCIVMILEFIDLKFTTIVRNIKGLTSFELFVMRAQAVSTLFELALDHILYCNSMVFCEYIIDTLLSPVLVPAVQKTRQWRAPCSYHYRRTRPKSNNCNFFRILRVEN